MDDAREVGPPAAVGEISDCRGCKWWMPKLECLLGRSPVSCGRNPARRGDEELAARILDLDPLSKKELRDRFERAQKVMHREHGDEKE